MEEDSLESLQRRLEGASDLESVVHTMKALAASGIAQYEAAMVALKEYNRTIELALSLCIKQQPLLRTKSESQNDTVHILIIGSDQGLVGQFNDILSDFLLEKIKSIKGRKRYYAVGERMLSRLSDAGLQLDKVYSVPGSLTKITSLISTILLDMESNLQGEETYFYIFHNKLVTPSVCEPFFRSLLPLDITWQEQMKKIDWPTNYLPEIIGNTTFNLKELVREYLFVSLFKSVGDSLVAENTIRMVAMQRAENNIQEIQEELRKNYHQFRQNAIDKELFDLMTGFELLKDKDN